MYMPLYAYTILYIGPKGPTAEGGALLLGFGCVFIQRRILLPAVLLAPAVASARAPRRFSAKWFGLIDQVRGVDVYIILYMLVRFSSVLILILNCYYYTL